MIQRSPALWQQELAQAVTDPAELLRILGLDPVLLPAARQAAALFPLRVPRYFIGRMRHGDPDDPLLRQVLPLGEELLDRPGFVTDPVGDHAADQGGGILRKYHGRALLITTGACAVHCRYCFRRHFPYTELSLGRSGLATTLDRLAAVPELTEVILSGGDPLTLSDQRLGELLAGIAALPRLRRLRIHTRLPVVLPSRMTAGLVRLIATTPLATTVVIHANHPQELGPVLERALAPLRQTRAQLLNQAVLLRGINDTPEIQAQLSEDLFQLGVLPYYLHQLDPVAGAAHHAVTRDSALALLAALRQRLPGYLVPRLVAEQAGAATKLPLELLP